MNYVAKLDSNGLRPYLFSYRRCPYAMRARMALVESNIEFDIYEISLQKKPDEMLTISSKGTVPVLKFNELVLDESLEIMRWAYQKNDAKQSFFLKLEDKKIADKLISLNDGKFKESLDCYKYFERYPDKSQSEHRERCYFFLDVLEKRLANTAYLIGDKRTYADISIFPFIRQFMNVDRNWFNNSEYKKIKEWLESLIESDLFKKAMVKPNLD